jgi:hypothetical protein
VRRVSRFHFAASHDSFLDMTTNTQTTITQQWMESRKLLGYDYLFVMKHKDRPSPATDIPVGVRIDSFWHEYRRAFADGYTLIAIYDLKTSINVLPMITGATQAGAPEWLFEPGAETDSVTIEMPKARDRGPFAYKVKMDLGIEERTAIVEYEVDGNGKRTLKQIREILLDPGSEHIAVRVNRALNIIDQAIGDSNAKADDKD